MGSQAYEALSEERKQAQDESLVPDFMTTAGYSMFKSKYLEPGQTIKDRYLTIAQTAGAIADDLYSKDDWASKFFRIIWKGWLSPSTPVLSNLGTTRGMPVSCEGSYVADSIDGFYSSLHEAAMLSKNGFGTSAYLGDIRPRGTDFGNGLGKASGVVPVYEDFVMMATKVSQGSSRRGAWAGYLEIDHPDFRELIDSIEREPAGKNVGWIASQDFIDRLVSGDADSLDRWKRILRLRVLFGKGYIWKRDTANNAQTDPYKNHGLANKASNLCSEITLHSDENHSYTCVLSSLNLAKYDEWKDEKVDIIRTATVFLDCVAEAFIRQSEGLPGLDRALRYTKKARSLGLGVMGWHDLLQQRSFVFDSAASYFLNLEIFGAIQEHSYAASQWMASVTEEPEWCKGTGMRNTHTMAVAPTMSTALIVGGTSQGIEPFVANVWHQQSAAGEMARVNPNLVALMKVRGVYNQQTIDSLLRDDGSVKNQDWLDDREKEIFFTAYEIDQYAILKQASERQEYIDQGQSLNLFFDSNATTQQISAVHKAALLDKNIKGLYYLRSRAGIQASQKTGVK